LAFVHKIMTSAKDIVAEHRLQIEAARAKSDQIGLAQIFNEVSDELLTAGFDKEVPQQRNDGCSKDNWVYAPVDNLFFAMFTRVDSR